MTKLSQPPDPPDPNDLLRRAQTLADSAAPATRALAQLLLRLERENQGKRR